MEGLLSTGPNPSSFRMCCSFYEHLRIFFAHFLMLNFQPLNQVCARKSTFIMSDLLYRIELWPARLAAASPRAPAASCPGSSTTTPSPSSGRSGTAGGCSEMCWVFCVM